MVKIECVIFQKQKTLPADSRRQKVFPNENRSIVRRLNARAERHHQVVHQSNYSLAVLNVTTGADISNKIVEPTERDAMQMIVHLNWSQKKKNRMRLAMWPVYSATPYRPAHLHTGCLWPAARTGSSGLSRKESESLFYC